jgi:hypothetical protein
MPKGQTEYNKCAEKAKCLKIKEDMGGYHKCARTIMCKKKESNALYKIQSSFRKGQETREINTLIKTFRDAVKKDKQELKIKKEDYPKYQKSKQYATHKQTLKKRYEITFNKISRKL